MKRLVIMAVMAAFILGTVGMAQAMKFEAQGDWRVNFNYVKNPDFDSDQKTDPFKAAQRVRTTFNFIANENLKAVMQFQVGEFTWGDDLDVGATANSQFNVRQAYVDFMIPNTEINLKAGMQGLSLPSSFGSHILNSRGPSVVGSTSFNDMVSLTAGWIRHNDEFQDGFDFDNDGDNSYSDDEVDMFFAVVPVTMDGIQVSPFAVYANIGKYAMAGADREATPPNYGRLDNYESSNAFWFGINTTVDMFDPIVVMADFNYGTVSEYYDDGGRNSKEGAQAGWIADLAVQYKMDMMTPMIFGLYESGESDDSGRDDKEGKIMPDVAGAGDCSGLSTFLMDGGQIGAASDLSGALIVPSGKWALGLRLSDISFVDKLTHTFQIMYAEGTNKHDGANQALFTKKDSLWEVTFDSQYEVYENLAAILELGYINMSLEDVDNNAGITRTGGLTNDDNAWKAAAGFRYEF